MKKGIYTYQVCPFVWMDISHKSVQHTRCGRDVVRPTIVILSYNNSWNDENKITERKKE